LKGGDDDDGSTNDDGHEAVSGSAIPSIAAPPEG
jgi:hypothetical protein